ncbi:MAG: tetratricopeptide repeat protein [Candidatus Delongbacteria bacterium]|nr:tetratricopeptide repeat protein [Candidatus Delongbacteria bacterium]
MIRKSLYLLLFTLLLSQVVQAEEGKSGQVFPFLRYGIGARAQGLGKAYTALSDDAIGVFWNPAGMARPSPVTWQVALGYDKLFFNGSQLGYAAGFKPENIKPLSFLSFGVSMAYLGYGDFPGRDIHDLPTSNFSLSQSVLAFSVSKNIYSWPGINRIPFDLFALGLSFNNYTNKIGSTSNSAFDLDLGLKFNFNFSPDHKLLSHANKVLFGLSMKNLMESEIGNDKNVSAMTGGIGFKIPVKDKQYVVIAADYYSPKEGDKDLRLGVEYNARIGIPMAIRAGYSKDEIGIGISFTPFNMDKLHARLDYAYTNQSEISELSNKFALTLYGSEENCGSKLSSILSLYKDSWEAFVLELYENPVNKEIKKKQDELINDKTAPCANEHGFCLIMDAAYKFFKNEDQAGNLSAISGFQQGYGLIRTNWPSKAKNAQNDGLCNAMESFLRCRQYSEGKLFHDQLTTTGAIASGMDDARYVYDLGLIAIGNKNYSDAVALFDQVLGIERQGQPGDIHYLAMLQKGRCLMEVGKYNDAIAVLDSVRPAQSRFNGFLEDMPLYDSFDGSIITDNFIQDDVIYWQAIAYSKDANGKDKADLLMREIIFSYPFSDKCKRAVDYLRNNPVRRNK